MINFNGKITVMTNPMQAGQIAATTPNVKVINIGEQDPALNTMIPNLIGGSILIPPYQIFSCKLDYMDNATFMAEYHNYLSSLEPLEFMSALLGALVQGTNMILFMTVDEYNLYFSDLNMFFKNMFGFFVEDMYANIPWVSGVNNIVNEQSIVMCMYQGNIITIQELLQFYPVLPNGQADPILMSNMNLIANDLVYSGYIQPSFDSGAIYNEVIRLMTVYNSVCGGLNPTVRTEVLNPIERVKS